MIGSAVFLVLTLAASIATGFLWQEERNEEARRAVTVPTYRDEWAAFARACDDLVIAIGADMLPAMEKIAEAFAIIARAAVAWSASVWRQRRPGETELEWWHRQIDSEKAAR